MKQLQRMLIAVAAVLGLSTVAPTPAPIVTAEAPATVSGCHADASHNPEGGWVWCDNGDSNDRYRVKIECVQKVSPYFTQTRYGGAERPAYASYAACSSGYRIIGTLQVQRCETYYQSPTMTTCSSGWAYYKGWYVSGLA